MKRISFYGKILFFVLAVVVFTGCSGIKYKTQDEKRWELSSDESGQLAMETRELQNEIVDAFSQGDVTRIQNFFSKDAIEKNPSLEEQINHAIDFLDGKIVSYDEPWLWRGTEGKEISYGAKNYSVKTDMGTEYRIGFKGWYRYEDDPDNIGVRFIYLINETKRLELEGRGDTDAEDKFFRKIGKL